MVDGKRNGGSLSTADLDRGIWDVDLWSAMDYAILTDGLRAKPTRILLQITVSEDEVELYGNNSNVCNVRPGGYDVSEVVCSHSVTFTLPVEGIPPVRIHRNHALREDTTGRDAHGRYLYQSSSVAICNYQRQRLAQSTYRAD